QSLQMPLTSHAKLVRVGGCVGVVLLASVRCSSPTDPEPLRRFETCDDLQLYLEDQILHPGVQQSGDVVGGPLTGCLGAPESAGKGGAPNDAAGLRGGADGRTFTTTNTQEVNVDEPDFVKNNGDVIFVLRRGEM